MSDPYARERGIVAAAIDQPVGMLAFDKLSTEAHMLSALIEAGAATDEEKIRAQQVLDEIKKRLDEEAALPLGTGYLEWDVDYYGIRLP